MNEQQQPRSNNTCLETGQLTAWRDGALPLREANEVTAHLAGCARCAAEERALTRDCHQVFDLLSRLDPAPNTHAEPAIALTRFQVRLAAQNTASLLQHPEENMHPGALPPSRSEREGALLTPVRLSTHRHHLAQTLVAALVIAALLGTILLLLRPSLPSTGLHPRQAPTAPPIGPGGTPVTAHAQAGGLEMTMRITPGPYFLSEMLATDLSLTNHSPATFLLQGTWDNPGTLNDPCQAPLKIVMTGGKSPYDTKLQHDLAAFACNSSPEAGTFQLPAAHTITVRQYIAITSSGHLVLTARAAIQKKVALGQDGVVHVFPATGPLDGHWPTLHVLVQTQVPSGRLLSLRPQAAQVIVDAPPAARGQLLYMSVYDCDLGGGGRQHNGTDRWIVLPTMTIQKPQCGYSVNNGTPTPDRFVRWSYVVGAPGYALASGTNPS